MSEHLPKSIPRKHLPSRKKYSDAFIRIHQIIFEVAFVLFMVCEFVKFLIFVWKSW
jgi:hypothetical protein